MSKRDDILRLSKIGLGPTAIADELGLSIHTVRYHKEPERALAQARRISEHRLRLKRKAVAYSGGCCLKCKYSACMAAMDFHHFDPAIKESGITNGHTRAWDKLKLELDKTILLCCRCHAEHHDGLWFPDDALFELQREIRALFVDKPLSFFKSHSSG